MLLLRVGSDIVVCGCFFFQAEDGIRDLVRSRGLGDVYKRQPRDGAGDHSRRHERGPAQRDCDAWPRAAARLAVDLSLIHI